jgi:UDP-N-acetylglucosamine 4-epimerase
MLALSTDNQNALNTVYNVAFGERATLNELVGYPKEYSLRYDPEIGNVEVKYDEIDRVIFLNH